MKHLKLFEDYNSLLEIIGEFISTCFRKSGYIVYDIISYGDSRLQNQYGHKVGDEIYSFDVLIEINGDKLPINITYEKDKGLFWLEDFDKKELLGKSEEDIVNNLKNIDKPKVISHGEFR